jgi:hypothetical protein
LIHPLKPGKKYFIFEIIVAEVPHPKNSLRPQGTPWHAKPAVEIRYQYGACT